MLMHRYHSIPGCAGAVSLIILTLSTVLACDNTTKIPPAIEREEPAAETGSDETVFPEVPETYSYDKDQGVAAEEFLKGYSGLACKVNSIPGTIEAEDFDKGENNSAYYESDTKTANPDYRGAHPVDIRFSEKASASYYIGEVQPGEWMSYTVEVEEDGEYSVETFVVKGDGSPGSFTYEVDGMGATRSIDMPLGDWELFTNSTVSEVNLQLTKGRHVIRYCASTPGNIDRMVFKRVGDIKSYAEELEYPVSLKMKNPLFVEFRSPMYNSWLTGPLYTADPSAHVWNINGEEVLYVYASHDMEPAVGCDRMDRYHVFSTKDMETWTDHGEIMNAATVRLHDGWGMNGFMWAPDCAYNPETELYYFYFPHPADPADWGGSWRTGVAVSKYPDRDFYVAGYVEGMPATIDPCVFVDDDGQPYIYNGGGGKCYGGKLKKNDWLSLEGEMVEMTGLSDFHEAAWVHKYDGKYYLSHSDNNPTSKGGNRLRYAVSTSPLGPWHDLGIYMEPTGIETNHGSIVLFKGQWYAFYHSGDYSGNGTLRSVCVDELTINPDGTLETVRQSRDKSKLK